MNSTSKARPTKLVTKHEDLMDLYKYICARLRDQSISEQTAKDLIKLKRQVFYEMCQLRTFTSREYPKKKKDIWVYSRFKASENAQEQR